MKKYLGIICALAIISLIAIVAQAAVPVSETVTLGTATGSAASTNSADYFVKELVYMQFYNGLVSSNVVTVSRVHNSATNTLQTLTLSSGTGTYYATNVPVFRFKGDIYLFTSAISTGATCEIIEKQLP